jgi:hypothetical protein
MSKQQVDKLQPGGLGCPDAPAPRLTDEEERARSERKAETPKADKAARPAETK